MRTFTFDVGSQTLVHTEAMYRGGNRTHVCACANTGCDHKAPEALPVNAQPQLITGEGIWWLLNKTRGVFRKEAKLFVDVCMF